jgi:eukaryotic-like serine/threonine-protein kinase
VGLSIDRYEVKRLIGQGAMGRIYLATDPKLGRDVAVKVLTAGKSDTAVRQRFRLEARAIAALKHPNIVELYDYSGEDASELFLVLEYVPGRALGTLLTERGAMPEAAALCVGHELALALEHAHSGSVLHRDIKPDNVLLHEGRIVLTDFGIVKQIAEGVLEDEVKASTKILGTPGFMAPEQFVGTGLDGRTDLFALGATLYYLATTYLPFTGDTLDEVIARVRAGKYEDPRTYVPLLSEGFVALVARCLAVKPTDRVQNAGELRQSILDLLRAHGVDEIRGELLSYERSPGSYVIDQRERGLDVLKRDLKVAIKDRDQERVELIIARMQTIAPIEERVKDVAGLVWDGKSRPRIDDGMRPPRNGMWFSGGVVLGVGIGVLLGLELLVAGVIPTRLVTWLELLTDKLSK